MIYIDDYPLKERYHACDNFKNNIDWKQVSTAIQNDGLAWLDVTSAIEVFPNLAMDESYRLFCCIAKEYHGYWGRVAALHKDDHELPKPEESVLSGSSFTLPANAAPPMQAIYRAGHAHGYLDAILCHQLLNDIPYAGNVLSQREEIITKAPVDFQDRWDVFLQIDDWRTRLLPNATGIAQMAYTKLLSFHRVFENHLESSNGLEKIYLDEYCFYSSPGFYRMSRRNDDSMYRGFINGSGRYSLDRRCCVFEIRSIAIARQRAMKTHTVEEGGQHEQIS